MRTVAALFGILLILTGVLLVLTGGGCTISILDSMLTSRAHNADNGVFLTISIVVLVIGLAMIMGGVALMRGGKGKPPNPDVF